MSYSKINGSNNLNSSNGSNRFIQKSKTKKKKEAEALQDIGEQLVRLSDGQIEDLALPEELYGAVKFAKTLKRGALKRQLQYIGALMRTIDPAPIREALENIEQANLQKTAALKEIEKWRDGLIAGNDNLIEDILNKCPGADRKHLIKLVLQARKEITENHPPRAYRELFRYLREHIQEHP